MIWIFHVTWKFQVSYDRRYCNQKRIRIYIKIQILYTIYIFIYVYAKRIFS